MSDIQVVILAAGMGTRLGRPFPKPLTRLASGKTIMQQQMDNLREAFGASARITVVVGFKLELILESFPDVRFAYNVIYDETNTAKSLLKGLRTSHAGGVLWMNGDVVFDPRLFERAVPLLAEDRSFVCVNTSAVSDEEVKYTVDGQGCIRELSKTVTGGLGEAVGINYVSAGDKPVLIRHLEGCADTDYFERGIETAIAEDGLRFVPLDISGYSAVEVDFEEDLVRANAIS